MYKKIFHLTKHGLITFVGFLLSPLSWWNDALINLPLSYFFAFALGWVWDLFFSVSRLGFLLLFLLGYWLTNLLGMIMMQHGVKKAINAEKRNYHWVIDLAISLGYSLFITALIYWDYLGILSQINVLPSWVE